MPLSVDSLNNGDCFVFDCGRKIFVWNGKESNAKERLNVSLLIVNVFFFFFFGGGCLLLSKHNTIDVFTRILKKILVIPCLAVMILHAKAFVLVLKPSMQVKCSREWLSCGFLCSLHLRENKMVMALHPSEITCSTLLNIANACLAFPIRA